MKKYASCVQGHQASRCGSTRHSLTYLQVVLLLAGCGRSPGLSADEGFRRIQEHEASLAEASAELETAADCGEARLRAERVCTESDALCRVAEELSDDDARARCSSSVEACGGARERITSGCATPAPT